MLPALKPGRLVLATTKPTAGRAGDVVIIRHEGIEKIKRISARQEAGRHKIFVLGDNPEASTDSRDFGWLPADAVKGKVLWPKSRPSAPMN